MSQPDYPALEHIDVGALIAAAGGDAWKIDASVQVGQPKAIADLAEAFREARGFIVSTDTEFMQARRRFEQSWNHLNDTHPINESAEVTRAVSALKLQSAQLDTIALSLELVAAKLAETQKASHSDITLLHFKLKLADARIGEALDKDDDDAVEEWSEAAIAETTAVLAEVRTARDGYAGALQTSMTALKANGYDAAVVDAVDGDTPAPAAGPGTAVAPPPGVAPVAPAGSLQDLLLGPGTPAPSEAPPGFLDHWKADIQRGPGDTDPQQRVPTTQSPLATPIVAANPSVVAQQQARVDAARRRLDAVQTKIDAAAIQLTTQGPGFDGPSRTDADALSQELFEARRELTRETDILTDLNQARVDAGGRPVPVPALPENADVQAFPPKPSGFAEGSRALNEGSLGLIPDVAKDIDVFTNWGQHSGADQAGAVLDVAGSVPIPGAKALGEGLSHGLDGLNAARHLDDVPTPHHAPDDPHMPDEHHTPDSSSGEHGSADAGEAARFSVEDTSALLARSEGDGHLIERHVGQTTEDLAVRLEGSPGLQTVSSFTSMEEAASAVSAALQHNWTVIDTWIANGARDPLAIETSFDGGAVLRRGATDSVSAQAVRVVLSSDGAGGWYVLTGYPLP